MLGAAIGAGAALAGLVCACAGRPDSARQIAPAIQNRRTARPAQSINNSQPSTGISSPAVAVHPYQQMRFLMGRPEKTDLKGSAPLSKHGVAMAGDDAVHDRRRTTSDAPPSPSWPGLIPAIHVFLASRINTSLVTKFILTAVSDLLSSAHPPSHEVVLESVTEREWGAAPAPAVFADRGPGSPWRAASRPSTRPRVNSLTACSGGEAGQAEVGHQGLKTPQWSAVRRAGFARPAPAPSQGQASRVRPTALCSLS